MNLIHNTETIDRKWFPGTNEVGVHVVREARLSDDLSEIRTRRLQHITITAHRQSDPLLKLDWDEAKWLMAALHNALQATADLRPQTDEEPNS